MTLIAIAVAAAIAAAEVTIPGPKGPLAGTLIDPGHHAPALILIPGSGPTDRNGDNPLGVKGGVYRQLADQLAAKGVATLLIDKRGMFGSKAAIADANAVRLTDYATDIAGWAALMKQRGKPCVWLAGHSEGGLVALLAAQKPKGICGLVLLASPGRPLGALLREQLKPQLPPAMMAATETAIATLEKGSKVDPATVPAPLASLFNPAVQGFLTDLMRTDPAKLAASTKLPMLIVQGDADLQVRLADAKALAAARPDATLVVVPGVNHLWKPAKADDRAANLATYADAKLAIDPAVATAVAAFVKRKR
ncbi:MAG: alpha/beta fold hydrolase [Sphingomicrobium sp.]